MTRQIGGRKALSQPVTTMILLVVPVMLTCRVVLWAYQIIGAQTKLEFLVPSNQHIWAYSNGTAFAALEIDSVGGRDAAIRKIEVRGCEAPWTTVYLIHTSSSMISSPIGSFT